MWVLILYTWKPLKRTVSRITAFLNSLLIGALEIREEKKDEKDAKRRPSPFIISIS